MNALNKKLIKEWLDKAEGDFEAAIKLNQSKSKQKYLYIIAFHCQQAVEKFLKALLLCHHIPFPKTHDLLELLDLIKPVDPFLTGIKNEFKPLNPFAINFRYPGNDISQGELKSALKTTKKLSVLLKKRINEFF